MASQKGEKEKGGGRFPEGSWDVLQAIIIDGEGGRFLDPVVTRDLSRNHEKQKVWLDITKHFNEVTSKYLVSFFMKGTVSQAQNRLKVVLLDRSWLGHPSLYVFKFFLCTFEFLTLL